MKDPTKVFLENLRATPTDSLFRKERWLTSEESHALQTIIITERIRNYYECGTANGFSAAWALLGVRRQDPGGVVHTWDPYSRTKIWDHPDCPSSVRDGIIYHPQRFDQGMQTDYQRGLGRSLFFIDGDHRLSSVNTDYEAALSRAADEDLIVLHDVIGYAHIGEKFRTWGARGRSAFLPTDRGIGVIWVEK